MSTNVFKNLVPDDGFVGHHAILIRNEEFKDSSQKDKLPVIFLCGPSFAYIGRFESGKQLEKKEPNSDRIATPDSVALASLKIVLSPSQSSGRPDFNPTDVAFASHCFLRHSSCLVFGGYLMFEQKDEALVRETGLASHPKSLPVSDRLLLVSFKHARQSEPDSSTASAVAESAFWPRSTSSLWPSARAAHAACSIGPAADSSADFAQRSMMFVFGGVGPSGNCLGDSWVLNSKTGQWSLLLSSPASESDCGLDARKIPNPGPSPRARAFHAMATSLDGRFVFLYGGVHFGPASMCMLADLWVFDTADNAWHSIVPDVSNILVASSSSPCALPPRFGHTIHVLPLAKKLGLNKANDSATEDEYRILVCGGWEPVSPRTERPVAETIASNDIFIIHVPESLIRASSTGSVASFEKFELSRIRSPAFSGRAHHDSLLLLSSRQLWVVGGMAGHGSTRVTFRDFVRVSLDDILADDIETPPPSFQPDSRIVSKRPSETPAANPTRKRSRNAPSSIRAQPVDKMLPGPSGHSSHFPPADFIPPRSPILCIDKIGSTTITVSIMGNVLSAGLHAVGVVPCGVPALEIAPAVADGAPRALFGTIAVSESLLNKKIFNVTGLTPDTPHNLVAIVASNPSTVLDSHRFSTLPLAAPDAPHRVRVTVSAPSDLDGSRVVSIVWKTPLETGGLPILEYRVHGPSFEGECDGILDNRFFVISQDSEGKDHLFTCKLSAADLQRALGASAGLVFFRLAAVNKIGPSAVPKVVSVSC
eukprot:ANDGO_01000.mRNA.1 hypothetical protein PTSG_04282